LNQHLKKIFSKKYFLLLVASMSFFFMKAQQATKENLQNNYLGIHWDVNSGLAHDQTYCMLKDVNGFMWIGTQDGLSRFDGNIFKNYFYDPKKPGIISGPKIQGLKEDSLHNIWIGTDKGLTRYDIKTDTFSSFFPNAKMQSLSTFIIPFWATKNEIFCDEADSFIISYNIHSLTKKILLKLTSSDSINDSHYAKQYFVFDSMSNSVWMLRSPDHGLVQINLATGKRTFYQCPSGEVMNYDPKKNVIWLNTDKGLIRFDLSDKKAYHISALKELEKQKITSHIGLAVDPFQRIWFNTSDKGIFIYDPKDESVHQVFENNDVLQKNIAAANSCIYCDRDGLTWTGSWLRFGIYQIVPLSLVVRNYVTEKYYARGLFTNDILNVVKGDHGKMWIGTGTGLCLFDVRNDTFTNFHEKNLIGLKGKIIAPIFADSIREKIWLKEGNPSDNIYEMDMESKICKQVVFQGASGQKIFPEISEEIPVHYKNGFIINALYNHQQCIFVANGDSAIAKQILNFPAGTLDNSVLNPTPVNDRLLFFRRSDVLGNLTYQDIGNTWIKIKTPMDSIPWTIIIQNKTDSSYWVVSLRQLSHYSHNFSLIKQYSLADGLPHDEIYGLIPDNKQNIWFNTNRLIYQLNVGTGQISALSEKDGFQISDFRDMGEGIAKDDNGDIYFTTGGFYKGFKKISPDRFVSPQSYVYIKTLGIKEFSLPISFGPNSVQQLSLKYFQNRINAETGTIDFYSQGKNHIRYKLDGEGRKEDWQYAPANYTIRYEELAPGKYFLQIQVSNAGNEFIGPVKTIAFQISPAFWNEWWFRIPVGILILSIFYFIMRWRFKQKFRLRIERSEKEKQIADFGQRTAELLQQKTELEMQALRAQMNPHFIFNSLNSINRFILQNNKTQASEFLTKFSKLVRLILQNSQASLISLESELESLELYLELEALRFNYHFDYKISVPKDMDVEVLKVPPLILQPYVENAIWHGLMHKEEKGQLDITVSEENDFLFFKIADDGIGRKQAAALSSKSATKHKSMGLRITADRIAILQNNQSKESPVTIRDLVHPDGSAAGTEILIKMPVIYD
jgi:hypothetical protein